jgi:hypothetical protein
LKDFCGSGRQFFPGLIGLAAKNEKSQHDPQTPADFDNCGII